jgi:hypothetical protein
VASGRASPRGAWAKTTVRPSGSGARANAWAARGYGEVGRDLAAEAEGGVEAAGGEEGSRLEGFEGAHGPLVAMLPTGVFMLQFPGRA